jgi:hypothetical protein
MGMMDISIAPANAIRMLGMPKSKNILKSMLFQNNRILKVLLKRWKTATTKTAVLISMKRTATGINSAELPKPAIVAAIAAPKDAIRKTMLDNIISKK